MTIILRPCQTIKVDEVLTSARPTMIFPTAAEDIFGEQLMVTMYRPSRDARPWEKDDKYIQSHYISLSKEEYVTSIVRSILGRMNPLSCYQFV